MSKESEFLVYCMEIVKRARGLSGAGVYEIFNKYDLFKFVTDFFELLHVHGESYILEDINARITELSN
ncbi:MAG: DUF3791 domain-containing protein [Oscillospiraceae bacterium]|nr:DUF3791 domain-containing protein [Oscillospiraceae bacterium]